MGNTDGAPDKADSAQLRVIVVEWDSREPPDEPKIDRAAQEIFRGTGRCPRIGEDPLGRGGDRHALTVSARPLTRSEREWIRDHWHEQVRHTSFGQEFAVPSGLPDAKPGRASRRR